MTIRIFKKPDNKDFETEVIERLDCLQRSEARSRQDIPQLVREIVREEIKNVLNERNRRSYPF